MSEILRVLQTIWAGGALPIPSLASIFAALVIYVVLSERIKDAHDRIFRKSLKRQIAALQAELLKAHAREDDAKRAYEEVRDIASRNIQDKNRLLWENAELRRMVNELRVTIDTELR